MAVTFKHACSYMLDTLIFLFSVKLHYRKNIPTCCQKWHVKCVKIVVIWPTALESKNLIIRIKEYIQFFKYPIIPISPFT